MEETPQRTRVRELAAVTGYYEFRAYMSSGLTNVPEDKIGGLERLLEQLFIEVFYPLRIFLYLPHIWSNPLHSTDMSAEDVHILDRIRIAESDFLVLCADYPSFGAGQEFEIAQAMGLRTIVFRHATTRVSRMLLGGHTIHVPSGDNRPASETILTYTSDIDLKAQLGSRVQELREHLPEFQTDDSTRRGLSATLRHHMLGRSVDELASETGMSPAFIRHVMSNPETLTTVLKRHKLPQFTSADVTKYVNPGLWVLLKLCRALNLTWEDLLGHIPTVEAAAEASLHVREQKRDAFWAVLEKKVPAVSVFRTRVDGYDSRDVLAARDDAELIARLEKLWPDDDTK